MFYLLFRDCLTEPGKGDHDGSVDGVRAGLHLAQPGLGDQDGLEGVGRVGAYLHEPGVGDHIRVEEGNVVAGA